MPKTNNRKTNFDARQINKIRVDFFVIRFWAGELK